MDLMHRFACSGVPGSAACAVSQTHEAKGRVLQEAYDKGTGGRVGCLQLRGEYLYVAQGDEGFEAYDVANIANKGFSERFIWT